MLCHPEPHPMVSYALRNAKSRLSTRRQAGNQGQVQTPLIVGGMNLLDTLTALQTQGIGLLEAIRGLSRTELATYGLRGTTAGSWLRLSDIFFGPTRERRTQSRAVAAAREGELSVEALLVIEKHVRKLLDGDGWALRAELCQLRGSVDEIDRAAAARVRDLNRTVKDSERRATPAAHRRGVRSL